jgi:hypothetical protein
MTRAKQVWLATVCLIGLLVLGIHGQGPPSGHPVRLAVREAPPGNDSDMKQPLELAARAKKAYAKVRDYTCTLTKQEKLDGELSPEEVIDLRMRTDPFSVDMRWRQPRSLSGQEVVYVTGKNSGKLRVRAAGFRGLIGFVSLSLDDPLVTCASKHSIKEMGIGHLIDQFLAGWKMERKLGKTKVRISTTRFGGMRCTRVELTHPTSAGGKLEFYRNVVDFDERTHLLVHVENYDWPGKPGGPGELVEAFAYTDLRLNVGLPDSVFEH